MLLARCPKCKSQYTISVITINEEPKKVKVCFKCGWSDAYNDKYARFFKGPAHSKILPTVAALFKHKYLPEATIDEIMEIFGDKISFKDGKLLVSGYKTNFLRSKYLELSHVLRSVNAGIWSPHIIIAFVDNYAAAHTLLTDDLEFGIRLYYYSYINDPIPVNVVILYNSPKETFMANYSDPDFYTLVYKHDSTLRAVAKRGITPILNIKTNILPQPEYLFLRKIEELAHEQWLDFGNTKQLWLDSKEFCNKGTPVYADLKEGVKVDRGAEWHKTMFSLPPCRKGVRAV